MNTVANTILSPKDLSQVWMDLAQDNGTPDSYELTEHAEIVMGPKPSNRHQVICAEILVQLWTQLGRKAVPEAAVITDDAGIRVPDVVWMPE